MRKQLFAVVLSVADFLVIVEETDETFMPETSLKLINRVVFVLLHDKIILAMRKPVSFSFPFPFVDQEFLMCSLCLSAGRSNKIRFSFDC